MRKLLWKMGAWAGLWLATLTLLWPFSLREAAGLCLGFSGGVGLCVLTWEAYHLWADRPIRRAR